MCEWGRELRAPLPRFECHVTYASSAVFCPHIPTSASEKAPGALWMHVIAQRRAAAGAKSRPAALT